MQSTLLERLAKKGADFLSARYPYICGAMTWVSNPELVAAVSEAGGFASLAGGNAPVEVLRQEIEETRRLTDRPFGVNVITLAPAYQDHLALVREMEVSHVILAGGLPRRREVQAAREGGAKVICFAPTRSVAQLMQDYGADALILEGMEAGGHVGLVTLSVLLQQVLFTDPQVPVFVGGGIATGRMCAHLFNMGAAGVQLGTRFAMAEECCAHPLFKEAFTKANARDAVSTPQFDSRLPVVAVRALRNSGTDDFGRLQLQLMDKLDRAEIGRQEAQQLVEEFWMGRLRDAVQDGDIQFGSLMAGQSVGLVDRVMPVREIIEELVTDTEQELQRVRTILE